MAPRLRLGQSRLLREDAPEEKARQPPTSLAEKSESCTIKETVKSKQVKYTIANYPRFEFQASVES